MTQPAGQRETVGLNEYKVNWLRDSSKWLRRNISVGWTAIALLHAVAWLAFLIYLSRGEVRSIEFKISAAPRDQNFHFMTDGMETRPTAPQTLVIPCHSDDFIYLPLVLESIANQTVFPHETILVLNVAGQAAEGVSLLAMDLGEGLSWENIRREAIKATPRRTEDKDQAFQYILGTHLPLSLSLPKIPGLRIFFRSGLHYAGSNRMYGASNARPDSQTISFFDCDDYLHPQRTEYLQKTFDLHPELEALTHGYFWLPATEWDKLYPDFQPMVDYMPTNDTFLWPYETLWDSLPRERFKDEPKGEPRQEGNSTWWFPVGMHLKARKPYLLKAHNGWVTVRKELLSQVPYPDIRRGQDSLFNWRLLYQRRHWNLLPLPLAAYVRAK